MQMSDCHILYLVHAYSCSIDTTSRVRAQGVEDLSIPSHLAIVGVKAHRRRSVLSNLIPQDRRQRVRPSLARLDGLDQFDVLPSRLDGGPRLGILEDVAVVVAPGYFHEAGDDGKGQREVDHLPRHGARVPNQSRPERGSRRPPLCCCARNPGASVKMDRCCETQF